MLERAEGSFGGGGGDSLRRVLALREAPVLLFRNDACGQRMDISSGSCAAQTHEGRTGKEILGEDNQSCPCFGGFGDKGVGFGEVLGAGGRGVGGLERGELDEGDAERARHAGRVKRR